MREIKFRAWSPYWKPAFLDGKPEAAMEYFKLDELSGGYTPDADIGIDEVDVVVMQYTGLKDRNGKEIYEGDIVKTIRGGTPQVHPEVVEFGEYGWLPWEFEAGDSYFRLGGIEVIGNIYENPDLLEVKDEAD